VTDASEPRDRTDEVATDLVQYVVIVVPDQAALATVAPALAELVETGRIRILDLVVLERDREGAVTVLELEAVESIAALRDVEGELGAMLSDNDIALASHALRPGTTGIVLVTEDRWAASLSAAARQAGGLISPASASRRREWNRSSRSRLRTSKEALEHATPPDAPPSRGRPSGPAARREP
jgi:Family of unknown function (DUF6325)